MADTTYTDNTTPAVAADWLNDLNRLHYTILGDPADAAAARTGLGITAATAQIVTTNTTAVSTGTTVLPFDDTIPQNTEGDQYLSVSITPKIATSTLEIDVEIIVSHTVASYLSAALFQDTTAGALAASTQYQASALGPVTICMKYTMTSGTTSATTFKVRAGSSTAGTTTFNGQSGTRIFGGVAASRITIKEYLP